MNSRKAFWAGIFMFLFLLISNAGAENRDAGGAASGKDEKPWLGVVVQEINDSMAKAMGLQEAKGVLVSDVSKGGPADDAGISTGDVIVRFDGRDIKGVEEFIAGIQNFKPGNSVILEVNRQGEVEKVDVVLGTRPLVSSGDYGHTVLVGPADSQAQKKCGPYGGACGDFKDCGGYGHRMGHSFGPFETTDSMKYGKIYRRAIEELKLSPEQEKKASALYSDYQKKTIRALADIRVAEVELRELASSDPVNLDKVRSKINEISAKKSELRFFRIKSHEDFKRILTDEQRGKLKEMMPGGMGMHMDEYSDDPGSMGLLNPVTK